MIADLDRLTLELEGAELRAQLAEVQEKSIKMAVKAGRMHARIEGVATELLG